ncbi:TetR/AcrR family transcriptional regulator [Protaetiibacter mangrovi]|uniref:TetR/AcrR family transcriptional regulator n=1 Tax=Protaetiibacter mangrovi TaxID=2970926 RepID=A0ABT1ZFL6_9MICO|nr:TetR/AcrR family transcriptional regulator [Protaetiibacter mangrovi]MCS0499435.1 TetR/AcrR family transcriptional regulator [Protaetiibacter mangrovi]TPX03339.1 TetR family transcriptional regulator [Schumannella luteola]
MISSAQQLLGERRPARADARRNFDALLTAARDAFADDGIDASLEDIARRAEVGIGTLYRNFPTRDALVETVYLGEVAAIAGYADDLGGLEPFPAFVAWLQRYAAFAATKRVLLDGINRDSPTLGACRGVLFDAGEPLLQRAQRAGAVRADVTIEDTVRLISSVAGAVYADPAQRERIIGVAVDGLRASA